MKKVMFFASLFYVGGTEVAILNLIKKLKGFDLYIGYSDDTSSKSMLEKFQPYAKIVNINDVDSMEVDIFVACSPQYHRIEALSKIKRNKTIMWIHYIKNILKSALTDEDEIKKIDHIVTVSNTTVNILKEQFPHLASKMCSIYNVIDKEEIKQMANEKINLDLSEQLNLVTVSRVCKAKGFERMLYLAKYLKEQNINFKWFIVGDNYYKDQFNELFKMFEIYKDNFVWCGFLDNPHNIVKHCDYSVLLSDEETWGLVLTEAMILKVPCITTDFEVAYEQVADGVNGIILSRKDMESYKDRIQTIILNKKKFKEALSNYDYNNEAILNEWEKVLL